LPSGLNFPLDLELEVHSSTLSTVPSQVFFSIYLCRILKDLSQHRAFLYDHFGNKSFGFMTLPMSNRPPKQNIFNLEARFRQ